MKNKKMFVIITTIVLLGLVIGLINIRLAGSRDENIENYKAALAESIQGNMHHYTMVDSVTNIDGQFIDEYYIEVYKLGAEKLRIDKSSSSMGEFHMFDYNGDSYDITMSGESVNIFRREGITPTVATPNGLNSSFYSISDKNVTYKETESQMIVTYDNKFLIGRDIDGAYWETDKDGYTSAVSVAYFDKEWNLEKLEITEKWISITADGQEYERIRKINIEYYDASEEEIRKIFEEEYKMLEDCLKE